LRIPRVGTARLSSAKLSFRNIRATFSHICTLWRGLPSLGTRGSVRAHERSKSGSAQPRSFPRCRSRPSVRQASAACRAVTGAAIPSRRTRSASRRPSPIAIVQSWPWPASSRSLAGRSRQDCRLRWFTQVFIRLKSVHPG